MFEGEPGELLAKHQLVAAPRAASVVGGIPPALDDAIAAMLAKDPAARPQTMGDVQRALERGAAAPATTLGVAGESTALDERVPRSTSVRAVVPGVALPVVAGVGMFAFWLATQHDDHRARAGSDASQPPAAASAPASANDAGVEHRHIGISVLIAGAVLTAAASC